MWVCFYKQAGPLLDIFNVRPNEDFGHRTRKAASEGCKGKARA